jgi:uncharacterized protein YneF (UPF0154 family)
MQTFTYGKNHSKSSFVLTAEEESIVEPVLGTFQTKHQAISYLYKRGWSTKAICRVIRYDDGRELREQHVNQVIQKVRAGK